MIVSTATIRELSAGSEPITTAYAKSHMRVDIADDDTLIANLVTAARQQAERYCNRSFVKHTWRADLPGFWDAMTLPYGPVQSITHIKYYDTASPSVLTTLGTSVYALNFDTVRRNHNASWESVYPRVDAVQITYASGYSDNSSPIGIGENVPEAVKAAILLIAADLYEVREAQIVGNTAVIENRAVKALLNPYRVYQ